MKRKTYNLSAPHYTTMRIGDLVPVQCLEVLPNDTIKASSNILARMAPMLAPIYSRVDLRVHHFYMSQKNIWEHWNEEKAEFDGNLDNGFDWKNFIMGKPKKFGLDAMPFQVIGGFGTSGNVELADKFGLPSRFIDDVAGNTISVNKGPFIMYNHIWNEYYADQQLSQRRLLDNPSVAPISYEKDYFTTARPFPTLDDTHTTIPIETADPQVPLFRGTNQSNEGGWALQKAAGGNVLINDAAADGLLTFGEQTGTQIDIQEFRRALALNRWAELQNKYGNRYVEYMKYYLMSQMPFDDENAIYLGGGSSPINISEVLQTAPETAEDAQTTQYGVGDMYGHGITAMRGNEFQATFDEHGYFMTLVSARPKACYMTQTERFWLKADRLDYYDPNLNDIGMQEVWEQEIFPDNALTTPWPPEPTTWGWQDRYAEYRSRMGSVTGEFQNILKYWTMGRDWDARPDLNDDFLNIDQEDTNRVFAVSETDNLYLNINHRVKAKRIVKGPSLGRTI